MSSPRGLYQDGPRASLALPAGVSGISEQVEEWWQAEPEADAAAEALPLPEPGAWELAAPETAGTDDADGLVNVWQRFGFGATAAAAVGPDEPGAAAEAAASAWTQRDHTPPDLPLRYAFIYGDEEAYRNTLHRNIRPTADGSRPGVAEGFACWAASVEGVSGHVFALTAAQFALLDELFPKHIERSSVLASVTLKTRHAWGPGVDHLACSTWIGAPAVAAADPGPAVAQAGGMEAGQKQVGQPKGPSPGSKRSLGNTSIGEKDLLEAAMAMDQAPPETGRASFKDSFGSDMRLSFGSDWRSSLPDLDLLPDMLDQPISAAAAAASAPPKTLSYVRPSKVKKQRPKDAEGAGGAVAAAAAAEAAEATSAKHDAEVQGVGLLPRGKDGRPKPSPPWIAAAVYWAALSDHELLSKATGISVVKPAAVSSDGGASGTAAEFRIVNPGHPTKQAYGREAELDSGVALTRFVLEVMKLAGSNVRLPGWDSMRKHLSPVWWTNPSRGGNRSRDFSQTYVERVPGSFAAQCGELQRVHPAMMVAAVGAWEEWYAIAAGEKRAAAAADHAGTEGMPIAAPEIVVGGAGSGVGGGKPPILG